MLQFVQIADKTLASGINQHNKVDSIPEGYSEDILNMDVDNDVLNLRQGFDRYAGDLPLRISEIIYTVVGPKSYITCILPDYVDLTAVPTTSPIYIQGKFKGGDGSYNYAGTSNEGTRYVGFNKNETFTLPAGVSQTYSVDPTQSFLTSINSLYQLNGTQVVAGVTRPSDVFMTDMTINPSSLALTLGYSSASDVTGYISNIPFTSENTYRKTVAGATPGMSVPIPEATHKLPNGAIFAMIYNSVSPTAWKVIEPDSFTIDVTANVIVTFANEVLPASIDILLFSGDATGMVSISSSPYDEYIDIPIANAETPHLFPVVYETNIATEMKTLVLPDAISYDHTTSTHTIRLRTYFSGHTFTIYYLYGSHVQNRIQLDVTADTALWGLIGSTGTSTSALSMAISGISQELLPVKSISYHVNGYLNNVEVITAVDGYIYRDRTWGVSEVIDDQVRVTGTSVIGPIFTSAMPILASARSRGFIVAPDTSAGGFIHITGVSYNSSSGKTTYTLSTPSQYGGYSTPNVGASISSLIAVGVDKLTVSGVVSGNGGVFNGTFTITAIDSSHPTYIDVTVTNPNVTRDIWNSSNVLGLGGIFTDRFNTVSLLPTVSGATLSLGTTLVCNIDAAVTLAGPFYEVRLSNVPSLYVIALGTRLGATSSGNSLMANLSTLVIGDSLSINGNVNRISNINGTAITLRDTVQVTDGQVTLDMPKRWQLILPNDGFLGTDVVPRDTYLHSINARGSLYFSSGTKYDGDKVYEIGVPDAQPQVAFTIVDGASGFATLNKVAALAASAIPISVLIPTTPTEADQFTIGDKVMIRRKISPGVFALKSTAVYKVTSVNAGVSVTIDTTLPSIGVGDELSTYRDLEYFLRYTLVDRNGATAAGRSSGASLFQCRVTGTAGSPNIRAFVPLNTTNINVDYTRMVIDLYRRSDYIPTSSSSAIPKFYKVYTTVLNDLSALSTANSDGGCYMDFADSVPLDQSFAVDYDPLVDPSFGGFGETREKPVFGKFSTSFNNQLAISNIVGRNRINLNLQGSFLESDLSGKSIIINGTTFKFNTSATPTAITGTITVASKITTLIVNAATYAAGEYIYLCQTPTANGDTILTLPSSLLGWYRIKGVANDKASITIDTPLLPDSTSIPYANLGVFHDAGGIVPLTYDPKYMNMLHTINNQGIIQTLLPGHICSAIQTVLFNKSGIVARGGIGDYAAGTIELLGDNLLTVDVTALLTVSNLVLFSNGTHVLPPIAPATTVVLTPNRLAYPSRVIFSEPGYPEVFQDIEVDVGGSGNSLVQDVNPDDGEETTAIIPFFGESIFGAALQSMVLVIFKAHSIFVYDGTAKFSGSLNYLQKLETRGLGCEAGFSVTAAVEGITFANKSGLYLINRKMMVVYFGKMLEELWTTDIDVSTASVSNFTIQRKLRMSANRLSDGRRVTFVLKLLDNTIDPTSQAFGYPTSVTFGWTRYEGIDAYQWANFGTTNTVFASPNGYVGTLLNNNNEYDYADDGQPIYASILNRPMVFESPATQKSMRYVTVYGSNMHTIPDSSTQSYMYYDLGEMPDYLDKATMAGSSFSIGNGISDIYGTKINSISYSPARAKATWYQFEWTYNGVYLPVSITRIVYTVAVLRTRGNMAAAISK